MVVPLLLVLLTSLLSFCISQASAATAAHWRSRSIYQLFTDRFALPNNVNTSSCDPGQQTWCGGTWNAIRQNLDYIQNAGFTAVWISPVNRNYDGPRTPYGDAYTGYWVTDVSQLNPNFGTADDLKALSAELHRRDMYLMVDLVLNNVMATSLTPNYSDYFFKDVSQYHPYCAIQWGNRTSEMDCWLGDTLLPLPDVNTENPSVIQGYQNWIKDFVQEFSIDGLRIDGKTAKHAPPNFWTQICASAGVFSIGEVFGNDINEAASYQGSQALDSVLNYPIYDALVQAFALPGPQNMRGLAQVMQQSNAQYQDLSVLGNFLENQDVPRWTNISVDIQSMYNAMVFTFMTDGIPIVYYGQEQRFSSNADPWNREPLWPSGYLNTSVYSMITTLNTLRNFLVNGSNSTWTTTSAEVISTTDNEMAILKGNVVTVVTNIGSPGRNSSIIMSTPWQSGTATMDVLSCTQWVVGSNGALTVEYTKGGRAVILVPISYLQGLGLCGFDAKQPFSSKAQQSCAVQSFSSLGSLWAFALVMFLVVGTK